MVYGLNFMVPVVLKVHVYRSSETLRDPASMWQVAHVSPRAAGWPGLKVKGFDFSTTTENHSLGLLNAQTGSYLYTQSFQKSLIKEYTLNHIGILNIISGILLN